MTPQELAAIVWTPLPNGQDLLIKKNYHYAALVSVSKSYTSKSIQDAAKSKGFVIEQWDEQGVGGSPLKDPNTAHRYIHVIVTSPIDAGTLPWKSPWPTTIYNIEKAWYSAPGGGGGGGAPSVAPPTNWLGVGIVAGAVAAAYGGWLLYRKKKRR
jgi:hypothetical protein